MLLLLFVCETRLAKLRLSLLAGCCRPWGLPNERCDELNCDYFCRQRDGQKSRKLCCSSRFLVSFHTHLNLESSFCVFFAACLFLFQLLVMPRNGERESEEGKNKSNKTSSEPVSGAHGAHSGTLSSAAVFFSSYSNNCFHFDRTTTTNSRQAAAREFTGRTKVVKGCHINHQMTVKMERDFTDTFFYTHFKHFGNSVDRFDAMLYLVRVQGDAQDTHMFTFFSSWCERWRDFPAPN